MTRSARTRTTIIAATVAIAVVAGNLSAYACSGQGIGTSAAADAANAPTSKTDAMPNREGATRLSETERLRLLREIEEARLRALREQAAGGAGSASPVAQSTCM
jgi:hypothetical protein